MAGPIETFVFELLAGTENGSVKWERTSSVDLFRAEGESGKIRIYRKSEEPLVISLTIADTSGRSVGEVETDPYRSGPWQGWERALMDLFDAAKLQAFGTTDVLRGLREEFGLPQINPPEDPPVEDDIPF